MQLLEFYWQKTNGMQVLATNLVPALANNNEWASLGTCTPLCLSWVVTSGTTHTLQYIKLSLTTHKWSKISAAELSTCQAARLPRLIAGDSTAAPPSIPLPRPGRNTDGTAVRQSSNGAGRDPSSGQTS